MLFYSIVEGLIFLGDRGGGGFLGCKGKGLKGSIRSR